MIFIILHITLLVLLFLPFYAEASGDEWDDEQTEARITRMSRTYFWWSVVAFGVCVIYDCIVWQSFTLPVWLFVGFLGLLSLWLFASYYRHFMRRSSQPQKKNGDDDIVF